MKRAILTEKKFDLEIEAIRALIEASARPFPDPSTGSGRAAQEKRKEKSKKDLEYFGKTYFPHYISSPCSALHEYICDRYAGMIVRAVDTGEGDKEADAAPRGNAKSTWVSLVLVIWAIAFRYRRFALIVSDTASQAEDFISFIKAELEINERLAQDFPEICGQGAVWRSDLIITRSGVKVRGVGAGQKLRGMRHGSRRPDLVIADDLENDEAVESVDQRKKIERWFFKALMKIGQKDTVYIVIGTILHYDSLLSNLLSKPGWKGRKFKAVIKFSASPLWEKWENIYVDIYDGKEIAEKRADQFFKAHEREMLAGTEVIWPEVEDYYYLMKMRISDGPAYFDSEKQNEPINPDDCLFQEAWFQFWEEDEVPALKGVAHYGAVDPSMGKKSKKHDPSAIMGGRMKDGIIYLDIADIEKRHPDKIIDDILLYHEKDKFTAFGVESIQFQEFFANTLEKEAHKRNLTLSVVELTPNTDKTLRIQTLQPWIKNGWIRFKKSHRALLEQLKYYPMADHDDGPDALEQLKEIIESNAGMIEFRSFGKRAAVGVDHYISTERRAENY
jgi:predicted phage terminase large subunit-like protein